MAVNLDFPIEFLTGAIDKAQGDTRVWLERFRAELDFAVRMTNAQNKADEWTPLLRQAAQIVMDGCGHGDLAKAVQEAEAVLAPLAAASKEYCVFCCGHAHIDMNWMWSWPETVSVTYDTFTTMDKLMDEFPEFHFSQSQASVYWLSQKYAPELFERIRARVKEGRWDITASQWVEGDKNLASGEILCRHLLYTSRWMLDNLDVPLGQVKIAWEPDTFGHCWTLPGILNRGGVNRYYHHRANGPRLTSMTNGETCQLFWWIGKDGSRVLAYDDSPNGYNCEIGSEMTRLMFAMEKHTGLKKILWVYGVGDHGGGPTRRHLRAAEAMKQWPIWPVVKLTITDDYFSSVEQEVAEKNIALAEYNDELNFVFEGCYTSEARVKFANRKGENDLVDTEIAALLASRNGIMAYPLDDITECWQRVMFMQFHDILPGSGVKETVEHCQGLLQENLATTSMIRTRGLRGLAQKIDTSMFKADCDWRGDMGLGAGVGNGAYWGGVSNLGMGETTVDPFVIFNTAPFARDEMVNVTIWNRELGSSLVARDAAGNTVPAQIVGSGHYWGHSFAHVAFPAKALPAAGYRTFNIEPGAAEACGKTYMKETGRPIYGLSYVVAMPVNPMILGNDLIEITVCARSGGIISIIDKATGVELVDMGSVVGAIERELEGPHAMTAWQLGPIVDSVSVLENSVLSIAHDGPNVVAVRLSGRFKDSEYNLVISLTAGSRKINFDLDVNWLERGDHGTGIPVLRASFPLAITNGMANFEIPCGHIERPADGEESPALNWVNLTGEAYLEDENVTAGATLVNDCKYGHQLHDDTIRLTLLRSSCDPDPLPEYGRHNIRFALIPSVGEFDVDTAIKDGYAFNHPLIPVGTTASEGELPAEFSGLEILTPNVMLSGLKQAENTEGIVLRLYEVSGEETRAQVRLSSLLAAADAKINEVDLLERMKDDCTAELKDGIMSVTIPPYGIASVMIW